MKLSSVLEPIERLVRQPYSLETLAQIDVRGIAYDSRLAGAGDLFIALTGLKADGADFAADAVAGGAVAVIAEHPPKRDLAAPWIVVHDAREAMALVAAEFYANPSHDMSVVGITGTNGKTTTAYLVRSVFQAAGIKCGLLGTVSYLVGDEELPASRTTPEAPDVQRMFRVMVDRGCGGCVMEVSSHALALKRVDGTRFAGGIFTNLTRDHLDYHGDMESYFSSKKRLFDLLPPGAPGIINLDDPRGETLRKAAARPVTYSINKPADVTPGPLALAWDGLEFDVRTSRGTVHVRSKLVGRPNVSNILATVALATALDLPFSAIERGLATLPGVPGRFQVVSSSGDDIVVVVDYAHTDDALRNLLETARPLAQNRVITVFGCGGDRDRSKRPLMGAVAARLSDVVVVTSDNPRNEEPSRIIEEIKLGVQPQPDRGSVPLFTIVDRVEAIEYAIQSAEPGDLVLLAGKGHEKSQVVAGRELPFDEVVIAQGALQRRRARVARVLNGR
jgi:UDP-N-acetylmuramoyl-L-alanyl-D-glutamate--2,6-diaminopimelate ligase